MQKRKQMKRLLLLATACLMAVSFAFAQDASKCSRKQAMAAEDVADRASSWDDLYRFYRKYKHCDDGAIAEGFDGSVTRLLERNWKEKKKIASLINKDKGFRVFVIRHVDALANSECLRRIEQNAREKCSAELKTFCQDVIKAATDAIPYADAPPTGLWPDDPVCD